MVDLSDFRVSSYGSLWTFGANRMQDYLLIYAVLWFFLAKDVM